MNYTYDNLRSMLADIKVSKTHMNRVLIPTLAKKLIAEGHIVKHTRDYTERNKRYIH